MKRFLPANWGGRRASLPEALESARSALVIKPSSLGDIIHALPAVARLHRARPGLALDWVANTEWAPLLEGNPALRRVIPMPRRQWRGWRDLPRAKRWAEEHLGPLRPDLALDFQGLLRSALLAKASGAARIVGFQQAREGAALLYDDKITPPSPEPVHAVDRYLALAEALGVPPLLPEERDSGDMAAWFPLPEGDPVDLPAALADRPFLLLHPFSRGLGKSLSFAETAGLCRRWEGLPVVLAGAGVAWPGDAGLTLPGNVSDLLGRTSLAQLIWLIRQAAFVVSVDSGPMHLAAALTGELLSLHTWTDPLAVGPWRRDAWVWRGGWLGRVRDIAAGQFPEQRGDRERHAGGILPANAPDQIAAFVADRMRLA